MHAKRGLAAGLGISLGILLAGGAWAVGRLSEAESAEPLPPPRYDLTGDALAEELGLELVSEQPPGCADYVVVESPDVGYCLEGKVTEGLDSWEIGRRLAGIVPSDLERRIFQVSYELAHVPAGSERFAELSLQLKELMEQRS